MSRKNRNKFRNRDVDRDVIAPVSSSVNTSSPARSAVGNNAMSQHTAEYRIISRDLIQLIILNGLMLVAVLALYYANEKSGFVERLYGQLF